MARAATLTKAEITRTVLAAVAAGIRVIKVNVDYAKRKVEVIGEGEPEPLDDLDAELKAFEARHAQAT